MGKAGATSIWWADYEGYFHLETTSTKLVETLAASGIRWAYKDEESGVYHYKLPTAWLRASHEARVAAVGLVSHEAAERCAGTLRKQAQANPGEVASHLP